MPPPSRSEVVFSVVRRRRARARESLPPFAGIFVDANAMSPATAARVGAVVERSSTAASSAARPPCSISPWAAERIAALFAGSRVETPIVANASALKCAYAGGRRIGALLLAVREFARPKASGSRSPRNGRARSRSSPSGSPRRSAPPRPRAGAGSARWRRSPRFAPTGYRRIPRAQPRERSDPQSGSIAGARHASGAWHRFSASAGSRGRPSTWPDPASAT